MKIGFVTDEISPDVKEALRIGASWGVRDYELRMVGENRIPNISESEVQRLLKLQDQYQIHFSALSPGAFKYTLQDKEQLDREIQHTLPTTFRLAKMLGAELIIVFGFKRFANEPPENQGRVVLLLKEVAGMAEEHGLVVAVENEPGFWCDSGQNMARILRKVHSSAMRANWDPANAIGTGERPYPEGYEAIKEWIANVHVKDTAKGATVACVPVGEGKVDWQGQLRALQRERIVEHVTIETHCLPLVEKSEQNLKTIRQMLVPIQ